MTFNMQHLIDFLRDFPASTPIERRFDLAAERWPDVTAADLFKAMNNIQQQLREQIEQDRRDQ